MFRLFLQKLQFELVLCYWSLLRFNGVLVSFFCNTLVAQVIGRFIFVIIFFSFSFLRSHKYQGLLFRISADIRSEKTEMVDATIIMIIQTAWLDFFDRESFSISSYAESSLYIRVIMLDVMYSMCYLSGKKLALSFSIIKPPFCFFIIKVQCLLNLWSQFYSHIVDCGSLFFLALYCETWSASQNKSTKWNYLEVLPEYQVGCNSALRY